MTPRRTKPGLQVVTPEGDPVVEATDLDETIPALGGLSPRQAVKTPEGRQAVLDLIACITRQQDRAHMPPSVMSPDYRKAKELLGL